MRKLRMRRLRMREAEDEGGWTLRVGSCKSRSVAGFTREES